MQKKKKAELHGLYALGIVIAVLGIIFTTVYTDLGFDALGIAFIIIGVTFLVMGWREMRKK